MISDALSQRTMVKTPVKTRYRDDRRDRSELSVAEPTSS
jgi:hypothetical protein